MHILVSVSMCANVCFGILFLRAKGYCSLKNYYLLLIVSNGWCSASNIFHLPLKMTRRQPYFSIHKKIHFKFFFASLVLSFGFGFISIYHLLLIYNININMMFFCFAFFFYCRTIHHLLLWLSFTLGYPLPPPRKHTSLSLRFSLSESDTQSKKL